MRNLLCFFVTLLLALPICAQEIALSSLAASIDVERLERPYLYFNQEDLEEIRERVQKDQVSGEIMAKLIAESNRLLAMPVDPSVPERGTNVRAGWTETDRANAYEKKMRNYSSNAEQLAFVYQYTKEPRYAQKAFEFAQVVCRMPVWILQAHEFSIIYSRVMPWNVLDNQVNFNFDIRTATIGESIACMYDWTYEALDKRQRDQIRGALLEKVITPVRGDYEFHWWATSYRCNWTGVCNGGLGVTAIALLKDHPSLIDVVTESYNRINNMMNEIGQDGGWQEGVGYLHYGLHHATRFAITLKKVSQGKFNLFENPKLNANPSSFFTHLFIPPNRSVNFGDSKGGRIGNTAFFNLLANETKSQQSAWYRHQVLGEGKGIFDLIFKRPDFAGAPPSIPSKHFRSIDWWVMRSDFLDENKVFLAGKAGKNDDPHHGHLDIGHFVLFWKGQAFIKDSGQPYYDEKYFDQARWDFPQASSAGHNVVLVNGEQQIPGKLKDQPFDHSIGGEVLTFQTTQQRDYVLMDPTNAYPKKELGKWQRHIILEKPNITLCLDDVETQKEGAQVDVQFHSEAIPQKHDDFLILRGEKAKMALIPLSDNPVAFYEGKHAYQPTHATRSFEWLPYFGVRSSTDQAQKRIANLIVPVEDEKEAQGIQASLKMEDKAKELNIYFEYRGTKYQYAFEKDKNQLRLK